MLKKILWLSLFLITSMMIVACGNSKNFDITTTLYPQYDIARQIAGNHLSVGLLTPFGSEVHEYSPTAKDIISIKKSKLFLYTSNDMEPWVHGILTDDINVLNLSEHYEVVAYDDGTQIDDLHFWTDPENILQLILNIRDAIIEIDPNHQDYYMTNAKNYYEKVKAISTEIKILTKDLDARIFFYGHNAMKPFENRYGIEVVSLSDNYKPDAEVKPSQLEILKTRMIDANAHFLFVEELIDLKAPSALVAELKKSNFDVELLELHGFHNISKDQDKEGISYADLLKQNYENIKKALNR